MSLLLAGVSSFWPCQEVPAGDPPELSELLVTHIHNCWLPDHQYCPHACRTRVSEQVVEGDDAAADEEQEAEEAATAAAVSPSGHRYARPTHFAPGSCSSGHGDLSDSDSEGAGSFSSSPGSSLSAISLRSAQSMPGSPSKAAAAAAIAMAAAAGREGGGGGKQPRQRHSGGGSGVIGDGGMQRAATSRAAMSLRPMSPAGREISAHLRVRAPPGWMSWGCCCVPVHAFPSINTAIPLFE